MDQLQAEITRLREDASSTAAKLEAAQQRAAAAASVVLETTKHAEGASCGSGEAAALAGKAAAEAEAETTLAEAESLMSDLKKAQSAAAEAQAEATARAGKISELEAAAARAAARYDAEAASLRADSERCAEGSELAPPTMCPLKEVARRNSSLFWHTTCPGYLNWERCGALLVMIHQAPAFPLFLAPHPPPIPPKVRSTGRRGRRARRVGSAGGRGPRRRGGEGHRLPAEAVGLAPGPSRARAAPRGPKAERGARRCAAVAVAGGSVDHGPAP